MTTAGIDEKSATIRALRGFVLLIGGMFIGMVQLAILPAMPFMAAHFSKQGDGDLIAQNIMTIAAPAMAVGGPLAGWLASRFGKRRVLLVSMVIYGITGAGGAFAPNLLTLLLSRILLGGAAVGYATVAVSLIGDYYAASSRDKLIGLFTAVAGGSSFGTLFFAGKLTEIGGWHAPFILYLIVFLPFVVAYFTIRDIPQVRAVTVHAKSSSIIGAWRIYALTILLSISLYTVSIQGVFLMSSEGITNPSVQSNVLLLATLGTMVGAYLFGFIRPVLGFNLVLTLTWLTVAIGNIGFASTLNVYLLAVCTGLVGLSSGFMQPLMQTAVLNKVAPEASTRAIGVAVGCTFSGQFLHPYILAALRAHVGLHDAFIWVGAASLAAGVAALLWPRPTRRPAGTTADVGPAGV